MTEPIVNNLTIQAATVNGSGSQTANLVLTRAIFHMGIPVAPKNVFPSNIEGLPTWYQLRITPQGHMARSDRVDILVAFNPTTWREDLKTVRPGGVVIHEESYSTADARTDVVYYPVPFAKLAKAKIASETLRKQLANMIYVGVVAGVLGIPWESLEHGVKRQFLAKLKAIKEGNGTLLDHSLILYGSGMGNPNVHDHINLPILVAGGAAGGMRGGRHIRFDKAVPLANLHLTLLDKAGVRLDKFGDSNGKLDELFEPAGI